MKQQRSVRKTVGDGDHLGTWTREMKTQRMPWNVSDGQCSRMVKLLCLELRFQCHLNHSIPLLIKHNFCKSLENILGFLLNWMNTSSLISSLSHLLLFIIKKLNCFNG